MVNSALGFLYQDKKDQNDARQNAKIPRNKYNFLLEKHEKEGSICCKDCSSINRASSTKCLLCGLVFQVTERSLGNTPDLNEKVERIVVHLHNQGEVKPWL